MTQTSRNNKGAALMAKIWKSKFPNSLNVILSIKLEHAVLYSRTIIMTINIKCISSKRNVYITISRFSDCSFDCCSYPNSLLHSTDFNIKLYLCFYVFTDFTHFLTLYFSFVIICVYFFILFIMINI